MPDQGMTTHLHAVLDRKIDHLIGRAVGEIALGRFESVELHLVFRRDAVEMFGEQAGVTAVLRVDGCADRKVVFIILAQGWSLSCVIHDAGLASRTPRVWRGAPTAPDGRSSTRPSRPGGSTSPGIGVAPAWSTSSGGSAATSNVKNAAGVASPNTQRTTRGAETTGSVTLSPRARTGSGLGTTAEGLAGDEGEQDERRGTHGSGVFLARVLNCRELALSRAMHTGLTTPQGPSRRRERANCAKISTFARYFVRLRTPRPLPCPGKRKT